MKGGIRIRTVSDLLKPGIVQLSFPHNKQEECVLSEQKTLRLSGVSLVTCLKGKGLTSLTLVFTLAVHCMAIIPLLTGAAG